MSLLRAAHGAGWVYRRDGAVLHRVLEDVKRTWCSDAERRATIGYDDLAPSVTATLVRRNS